MYIGIKKGDRSPPIPFLRWFHCKLLISLHQIFDPEQSVINVRAFIQLAVTLCQTLCEWVCNHTVTGLESNLRLEGELVNSTNHLERNIWAVEQTSVIRRRTLISDGNKFLVRCITTEVWVNIDLNTTV